MDRLTDEENCFTRQILSVLEKIWDKVVPSKKLLRVQV